jgi:hypothetical protein
MLVEYTIETMYPEDATSQLSVLNPNCGRGNIALPLAEYFAYVGTMDTAPNREAYPQIPAATHDFISDEGVELLDNYEWIIAMPPRGLETDYALQAIKHAAHGVAMLVQVDVLQSVTREAELFKPFPCKVAFFPQRLNIKAHDNKRGQKAPGQYVWLVWNTHEPAVEMTMQMYPPKKVDFEIIGDYDDDEKTDEKTDEEESEHAVPETSETSETHETDETHETHKTDEQEGPAPGAQVSG